MTKKSQYNYKQIKDIVFKTIREHIDTPVLFRQLQYQSMLIFMPSDIRPLIIKQLLENKNTNWHFIVVADDYMLKVLQKEKEQYGKDNNTVSKGVHH